MMAGAPDIIACVPVSVSDTDDYGVAPGDHQIGIFVGFETKTPSGGDPTPIQNRVHDKIRAACGQVFVPRSVADAVNALESLGWVQP